ncbi:MAG: GNAT family acetyltransferase [Alphaproteobacteria bacterium]|nr:GNAT family acetyltransferase [Alphaproteobacteria bacterium]
MTIVIRVAGDKDKIQVISLWRLCKLVADYNNPDADFSQALGKSNSDILVGVDANENILAALMVGHDGHRGWIYYVAVHPEHQNQGFGSSMVDAAEKWLSERNIRKLMLLVREDNTQVVDFYKKLSFEEAPRVVMQKWLV